ncbi:hypothetical protein [Salinispora arenicola]|uniref:hypothetical protein n=1 Tax=Salinispora arenicola TaxID=168697 RepID=UPI0012BBECAB|nr:hypothetical protein [Salinispora arenicola]
MTSKEFEHTMIHSYSAASLDAPDRLFQLTHASRTRTQLWLQADAAPSIGINHRLEILFQNVQYVCSPFALRGLSLRRATQDESGRLSKLHGLEVDPDYSIYLLSRSHTWFIVSAKPIWAEADLSYNDKPVFFSYTGREDVVISMGTIE